MKTYIIKKGSSKSRPVINIFFVRHNELKVTFRLGESFLQLYDMSNNSTHKIIGFSDLFGRNSVRLGFRTRKDLLAKRSFASVAYMHNMGQVFYPRINNFFLEVGVFYVARIYKHHVTGCYSIDIAVNEPHATLYSIHTNVKIRGPFKRMQAVWMEPSREDLNIDIDYELL